VNRATDDQRCSPAVGAGASGGDRGHNGEFDAVRFAESRGFNSKQMSEIRRLADVHRDRCMEAWDEFFARKT